MFPKMRPTKYGFHHAAQQTICTTKHAGFLTWRTAQHAAQHASQIRRRWLLWRTSCIVANIRPINKSQPEMLDNSRCLD